MGEGAGVLVLEDAELADARGAAVLGEVLGYAATSDAHHLTAPDPTGASAALAITRALADAELTPDGLDYVNAHGTSTPLNDRAETVALKAALGAHAAAIPISSTKSAIGHLLGAAGAVEAVATILALRARMIPPTLGLEVPDPELDLDFVPGEARPLDLADGRAAVAISNSFGFGGHNTVLCLEAT
jgi:3-oxoacyl-[acyl-carrier-protein] synthase II